MTLCIAWKKSDQIYFASDSRIASDDDHFADIAVKVMEVPIRIKNPIPVETGKETVIYEKKLGICYCGDTLNALLIKEAIYEALQKLQFIPYRNFSLEGICKSISKFVVNISDELRFGAGRDPNVEFLIGGFCPSEQKILVYKLELVDYGDHYEVLCDEVLIDEEEIITLGSGSDAANEIINTRGITAGLSPLKVLREICHDENEPSVGGYLQFGNFENNNFTVFGVQDYRIDENDNLEYLYTYQGTLLYKGAFEFDENDFHIAPTFIMPFGDEISDYWRRKEAE